MDSRTECDRVIKIWFYILAPEAPVCVRVRSGRNFKDPSS